MGRISEIAKITNQITKQNENISNLKRRSKFLAKMVEKYKAVIASENQTDIPFSGNNNWFNDLGNHDQRSSQTNICFSSHIDRAKFDPPEFHQNGQQSALKKLLETNSIQYPINKLKQSINDSSKYSVTQNEINLNNNKINYEYNSFSHNSFSHNSFPVKLIDNIDINRDIDTADSHRCPSEFLFETHESLNRGSMIMSNYEVLKSDGDSQLKEDIQDNIQRIDCISEIQTLSAIEKLIDETMQPSAEFWDNNLENTASLSLPLTKNERLDSFSAHEDEDPINLFSDMIDIDKFKKFLSSENLD